MKYVLVTIFFLLLTFSISDEQESPTYFTLAMHWPISLCNVERPCSKRFDCYPPPPFTIHGLWSYNANGDILMNCTPTEEFSNSKVSDIKRRLDLKWPDFYNNKDKEFWKVEWKKHGSCSGKSVKDYFQFTLDLAYAVQQSLEVAAQSALSDRNGHNGHERGVLYKKFNAKFPQNVQLKCNFRQHKPQLLEVHICFDAVGNNRPCGERFNNCGGGNKFSKIYFPDTNTLPKCLISEL